MPYIHESERELLQPAQEAEDVPQSKGQLTYVVTREVNEFLQTRRIVNGQLRFDDLADAIAALECAKLEMYRRLLAPYEDKAIQRNGDVFNVL